MGEVEEYLIGWEAARDGVPIDIRHQRLLLLVAMMWACAMTQEG